jgi:hypothetical protein
LSILRAVRGIGARKESKGSEPHTIGPGLVNERGWACNVSSVRAVVQPGGVNAADDACDPGTVPGWTTGLHPKGREAGEFAGVVPGVGHIKTTQDGQLLVLSSRKRVRIFTETMGVVARQLCGVIRREERALGAPNSLVGECPVPLFHMSVQVASAEALRVCAPR